MKSGGFGDWAWEIVVVEPESRRAPRIIRVRHRGKGQPEEVIEVSEDGLEYVLGALCRRLRVPAVIG